MSREVHVRCCEQLGGRFPGLTRQIILVKSEEAAKRVMKSITDFIENRMLLKVNREKSRICSPWELNFLGYKILKDGGLGISQESLKRFKEKLRRITRRNK